MYLPLFYMVLMGTSTLLCPSYYRPVHYTDSSDYYCYSDLYQHNLDAACLIG